LIFMRPTQLGIAILLLAGEQSFSLFCITGYLKRDRSEVRGAILTHHNHEDRFILQVHPNGIIADNPIQSVLDFYETDRSFIEHFTPINISWYSF